MAMRRGSRILLAIVLVPVAAITGLMVWVQFGPSIEMANQIKGGMTRDGVVKVLGPPTHDRTDEVYKRILGWDLKEAKFEVYLDRKDRVTLRTVDDTQPLSADAPGAATAKSLADTGKFRDTATRSEVEQILGPPKREHEEVFSVRSMAWECKDGVISVRFDRNDRVYSDGVKTYPEGLWERLRNAVRKLGPRPPLKGQTNAAPPRPA